MRHDREEITGDRYVLSNGNPAHIRAQDVQAVGEALGAIQEQHGDITPGMIVDAASDPQNILHGYVFGASDKRAALSYRLILAAKVRRSIHITIKPNSRPAVNVPAFVRVGVSKPQTEERDDAPEPETHFISVRAALSEEETRAQARDLVFGYVYRYRDQLSLYSEFRSLVALLDKLNVSLERDALVVAKSPRLAATPAAPVAGA
jgi:hypothetical protein